MRRKSVSYHTAPRGIVKARRRSTAEYPQRKWTPPRNEQGQQQLDFDRGRFANAGGTHPALGGPRGRGLLISI